MTLVKILSKLTIFYCVFLLAGPASAQQRLLYEQAVSNHSATILLVDPDTGAILDANKAAQAFYGYDWATFRSMAIQDINQLTPEQVQAERQLAKSENRNFFIFRHRLADGSVKTVEVHSTPIDYLGRTALMSIIHDISADSERKEELWHYKNRLEEMVDMKSAELASANQAMNRWMLALVITLGLSLVALTLMLLERNAAHRQLRSSEQRLREIIFGTNVGTWEWNVQTGDAVYNERWAEIIGYSLAELTPTSTKTWESLAHPDDVKRSQQKLQDVFAGRKEAYDCEIRMRHKDGRWIWVLDRGRVVEWAKDGKPLRMSGTHADITQMKQTEEEVRRLAMTDYLTGLSNRAHFSESLEENVRIARRDDRKFALMMLDLNTFKPVNDSHGHPVGDALLKSVAETIKKCTRDGDIVTRIGGDEFAVIIGDYCGEDDVLSCAGRIYREISKPTEIQGKTISITVSIGISYFPNDADTAADLIKRADQAMYQAKKSGSNVLTYKTFRMREAS